MNRTEILEARKKELQDKYQEGLYDGLVIASIEADKYKSGMGASRAIIKRRLEEIAKYEGRELPKENMQQKLPFESV